MFCIDLGSWVCVLVAFVYVCVCLCMFVCVCVFVCDCVSVGCVGMFGLKECLCVSGLRIYMFGCLRVRGLCVCVCVCSCVCLFVFVCL